MAKLKQVWSNKRQSYTWAFDAWVADRRYRRTGFTSREEAETALGDFENSPVVNGELKIGSIGAVAEILVCADLLGQGFDVFRSISTNAACDVIAASASGDLCRIEVKSALMRKGAVRFKRHRLDNSKYDVLALVFLKERRIQYSSSPTEWFSSRLQNGTNQALKAS